MQDGDWVCSTVQVKNLLIFFSKICNLNFFKGFCCKAEHTKRNEKYFYVSDEPFFQKKYEIERETDRETVAPALKSLGAKYAAEYCTGLYLPGISRLQCGQSGWGRGLNTQK